MASKIDILFKLMSQSFYASFESTSDISDIELTPSVIDDINIVLENMVERYQVMPADHGSKRQAMHDSSVYAQIQLLFIEIGYVDQEERAMWEKALALAKRQSYQLMKEILMHEGRGFLRSYRERADRAFRLGTALLNMGAVL